MRLSYMPESTGKKQRQIITFAGLNYGDGTSDGELADCRNLSTARFPCLSQRAGRTWSGDYPNGTNLFRGADGKELIIDGISVLYDGHIVGAVEPGEKQIVSMGNKILIFPDGVCYERDQGNFSGFQRNFSHFQDLGKLRLYGFSISGNTITLQTGITSDEMESVSYLRTVKTASGILRQNETEPVTVYNSVHVDQAVFRILAYGEAETTFGSAPAGKYTFFGCDKNEDGEYTQFRRIDSARVLPDGTAELEYTTFQAILTDYPLFSRLFREGDEVELSFDGALSGNDGTYTVRSASGWSLTVNRGFEVTGDYPSGSGGEAVMGWKYPALSCVCQSGNRLWGAEGNTIYASALGDPTSFFDYSGLSTDSYAAAVGTDGPFTACCEYGGAVLFWKENCLHKVLGSYPAQYEIYTYQIPGVMKGSEKSMCNISETLYYHGRNGIYAYSGGAPELLTEKFGPRRFHSARSGTDGERYYVCMRDENEKWQLYSFDPALGIWLREDEAHAAEFSRIGGQLSFMDRDRGAVCSMGKDTGQEGPVSWSATLCPMDETTHGRKCYSKLLLRTEMEAGSWLKVEVSTDGGPFRQVFLTHNQRARTLVVPILPSRCDRFQIRLSGEGVCVIRSLVREFGLGSEY